MLTILRSSYFTEFLESLTAGTLIVNSNGVIYAGNSQAAALLGTRLGLLNGTEAARLAGLLEPFGEFLAALKDARRRIPREKPFYVKCSRPDLPPVHLSVSVSLLVEYDKLFGILLQFQDISEMVDLHEREKRALEERAAVQHERIASLRNFSMAVAHQIRNPLMCIGGFAMRLAKKFDGDEAATASLGAIVESAGRLEAVVAAVSDYSRLEGDEVRETGLRVLVEETAAEALAGLGGDKPFDLSLQADEGALRFAPGLLSRAIAEAVKNAFEALPATGGRIAITSRAADGAVTVEIADNGPGVAPDILPFAFDPFFTTKAVGVGMGLAKARQCLDGMHGDIALHNGAGGGAVVVIRFPAVCDENIK